MSRHLAIAGISFFLLPGMCHIPGFIVTLFLFVDNYSPALHGEPGRRDFFKMPE